MSASIVDPDDYTPGAFRDAANDVIEVIEAALDSDGLNAVERGTFVALRVFAMETLRFREPVPHFVPAEWNQADRPAPSWSRSNEERKQASLRWRRMTLVERDHVILDLLDPDERLAAHPLWARIVRLHDGDLFVTDAALRKQLKSMVERRVLATATERSGRGRPRTCWYVPAAAEAEAAV